MKRISIFILVALSVLVAKAQFNSDFMFYERYGNSVNLNAEYGINSNAVKNGVFNNFIYGGFIDDNTKNDSQKKLKLNNIAGGSYNLGATVFFSLKPGSSIHFMAGLKQTELANAAFGKDAYNLMFYGNKMYQGQTADVSNLSINHLKYQEIKLGFVWDNGVDTAIKVGASVSYLKGQTFMQATTGDAYIYTAADASQINFNMHSANLMLSDTGKGKSSLGNFNGNGFSIDLFANLPYTSPLGKSKLFVYISNLGAIKWNSQTVHYTADTNYAFRGVVSNNLFQINSQTAQNISKDSLVQHLTKNGKQSFMNNLPMTLLIFHNVRFTKLFGLTLGFRELFYANYKPYFYAEGQFFITPSFTATAHLGYGGYGQLSGGLNLQYQIKKYFIRLGSNAIQGYVLPKQSLGQGLFLSLSKKF
ncbi:MAG: hypothetical protein JST67_02675 [Bacteroidetes bacterium]|nr:hypothetical protein [Bacteroidota bacterium]